MKKNGFTLTELITIIALLSIVMVVMIPKINLAIKESRADQLEEVREMIVDATDVFLNTKCGKESYESLIKNDQIKIYLNNISGCGLIDNKIYNPVADNYFNIDNEYVIVTIDEIGMIDYELSF